ncbi:glutathione S-transferase family protein [Cellvibrio mixtus]|uniref:glutathione S-transferase family protein n=1 Tax=Cellvibrio mixtus TaxID=39650 RepID=UPI0005877AF5|nr:glutathione S-transferase N-terminal domain-containing protein [Cellvibrio mixtus]
MLTLYEFGLSGNCHKVRLLLSLLGLQYQSTLLNNAEREHKTEQFLQLNPFGQVPVLTDGDTLVRDSQAILVYLARTYGADEWFPHDPAKMAEVVSWLAVAANEVARGPNALRLHHKFGRAINIEEATQITVHVLSILDTHLQSRHWLANNTLTIADIAIYPYIALVNEGKFNLEPYLHVQNWMGRIEHLTGYITMPGIQQFNA